MPLPYSVKVRHQRLVREPVVRAQRRGAGPHFVIEEIGHGLERRIAVGAHVEVTAQIDVADLAEQAGFDDLLLRVDEVRRALALRADLHHALVLARGIQHGFAFAHVAADGLLAINIRAGFNGRDAMQRVPVIRRTDEHDVEVLSP